MKQIKQPTSSLPADVKWETVSGQPFVRVREAAKLANVHPVALEMGRKLLDNIGAGGAAFTLSTPAMKSNADAIAKMLRGGLKRVAKAFEPNKKLRVKSHRDGDRLVFWYGA